MKNYSSSLKNHRRFLSAKNKKWNPVFVRESSPHESTLLAKKFIPVTLNL
jgi:hypothetical protein